jgi:hypothetical protein
LVPENQEVFFYTSTHEGETPTLHCHETLALYDAMILFHISAKQRPQESRILGNYE